jgi:rubrerythrin
MYPPMIEDAKAEGKKSAQNSLTFAYEVEKIHAALYKKALEALGKNEEIDYYVCQICGNTVEGEPPDQCPICKALKKMFKRMD